MHADIEGRAAALDRVEEVLRGVLVVPSLFRGDRSLEAKAYGRLLDLRADLRRFEDPGDLEWVFYGVSPSRGVPIWHAEWVQRWAFRGPGDRHRRVYEGWVEGPTSPGWSWSWSWVFQEARGYARTQAEAQAALESAARAIWREGWERRVRNALEKIRIEGLDPGHQ
jgi:hypothetical protein